MVLSVSVSAFLKVPSRLAMSSCVIFLPLTVAITSSFWCFFSAENAPRRNEITSKHDNSGMEYLFMLLPYQKSIDLYVYAPDWTNPNRRYRRTAVRLYFPIISNNYTKPYRNCQIFVLLRGDEVILLFQNFIQRSEE